MNTPIELHGLLISPPIDPQTTPWTCPYRPARPTVAPSGNDQLQFSLIEAGSVAMLAVTTQWAVTDQQVGQALAQLAASEQREAQDIDLVHEPLMAERAELLLGHGGDPWSPDNADQWTTAASAGTSGMPPYNSAFSLMLNAEQRDQVRQAMSGYPGWLGVLIHLQSTGSSVTHSSADLSATATTQTEVAVDAPDTEEATRYASGHSVSARVSTDSRTSPPVPPTLHSFSDAVDWGLKPP